MPRVLMPVALVLDPESLDIAKRQIQAMMLAAFRESFIAAASPDPTADLDGGERA